MANISNSTFIVLYITHPTENVAKKITNYLLDKKLIACANLFPITSSYWWNAATQSDKEWVSIVKTRPELWEHLCVIIEDIHPYDVPCITKFEVTANAAYVKWIRESVKWPQA